MAIPAEANHLATSMKMRISAQFIHGRPTIAATWIFLPHVVSLKRTPRLQQKSGCKTGNRLRAHIIAAAYRAQRFPSTSRRLIASR
jgi:hypothetical protein